MKKLFLYILISFIILNIFPYLLTSRLRIISANEFINRADKLTNPYYKNWCDSVFVNINNPHFQIKREDLNILTNKYYVGILKEKKRINTNSDRNATIVIDQIKQYGCYAETYVEFFAGEGTKFYKERYICILFYWIKIDEELTGMA